MGRPWTPTPEDDEKHGPWSDYTAFVRWWGATVEDAMPTDEPSIWGGMNAIQQAYVYAALAKAFDATRQAGTPEGPALTQPHSDSQGLSS